MLNNQRLFSEKGNCSVVFLLRRGVQQTAGSVQLSQVWCDWHPLQRRLVAACRNVIIICRSELGSFNCLNTLLLVFSIIQSRILSPQIELYRLMAAVLSPFNRSVASLKMREACIILTFWVSGKLHSIIPIVESIIMFTTIKFKVIFVFRICLSNCTLISALNLKRKKKEGGGWEGERERPVLLSIVRLWALWDASQEASCESETVMMEEREVRVVVVGDQRCGKSALISRSWDLIRFYPN